MPKTKARELKKQTIIKLTEDKQISVFENDPEVAEITGHKISLSMLKITDNKVSVISIGITEEERKELIAALTIA